jgi:hypothetical protein
MLAPVIAMKRTLILLFTLLALGTFALAASLPSSGTVTVKNDSGIQVGTGTIANGKLSLSLASGTSGFVTITVTGTNGSSQSYEAMVNAGGQVTVVNSGQLSDLSSFAKTGGVDSVDVSETTESQTSQAGPPESPDSAATTGPEDASSETGSASSGSSQLSSSKGSRTSVSGSGPATKASSDSSPDSSPDTSASKDSQTETGSTSGDDQVKVGANLSGGVSTHTGSDGTTTDSGASGSASTDD